MTTKAKMRELADDLEMMASQIRESTEDRRNHPPSPWTFDDWFTRYRTAFEATPPSKARTMTMGEPFWAVILPGGKALHYFKPHPLNPQYVHSPCGQVASEKCIAVPANEDGSGRCKLCHKYLAG